jgi:hypothetical protein
MLSEPFIIEGATISFLVGGGCDMYTEYVELLVDGLPVKRATGACRERMDAHAWNVSVFTGRAAQLRVVDASSSNWGHINVDHFTFDWDVHGGVLSDVDLLFDRRQVGGRVETALAGAAYVYRLHENGSDDDCSSLPCYCVWSQEAKLLASDKRFAARFGASVAVSAATGVVAVGAPGAELTGFNKETLPEYPYTNTTIISLPQPERYATLFMFEDTFAPQRSAARGLWTLQATEKYADQPGSRASEEAGAVYVFVRWV